MAAIGPARHSDHRIYPVSNLRTERSSDGSDSRCGAECTRRIKLLFLAIILVYPVQLLFVWTVSEPYPALMMPEFRGTGVGADGIHHTRSADVVIRFADGPDRVTTPARLFAQAPSSHHWTLMGRFRPRLEESDGSRGLASRVKHAVRDRLDTMLPVPQSRETDLMLTEVHTETREWLRDRVESMYPGRMPVSVDFVWYDDAYPSEERGGRRRRVEGTLSVELP